MGEKKGKKGKKPADDDDGGLLDFGMGLFDDRVGTNDWGTAPSGPSNWGVHDIPEEDEDDEDEDDEEEEEEEPQYPPSNQKNRKIKGGQQQQYQQYQEYPQYQKGGVQQKANKGDQQQHQQGGKKGQQHQQQNQRKNENEQNKQKTNQQKNRKDQNGQSQDGQKGQKPPKQKNQKQQGQQEQQWGTPAGEWGARDGGGGWDGGGSRGGEGGWGGGGSEGANGWEGGGSNDWSQSNTQNTHPHGPQRRLASLLNHPTGSPPNGADRVRMSGSHQQWQPNGRGPTAAERVKAAANVRAPSRTLRYAATGSAASILDGGTHSEATITVQIMDSGGAALEEADKALYSRERPASQRIHWMFSPTKDERVASLLDWVQAMNHGLATLGLHKFLHSKQRGALLANANYRSLRTLNDPVFDWVTFDDVIETHDKTLQESMALYDPESQVLVFVFLLSRSGNSLAMWRRKIPVPNALRRQNQAEIARLTKTLSRRKYVITVDELPPPPDPPKRKKWFNVRW